MPRIRKRDWPITVYKYAVTSAEIPESMWTVARSMQSAWNQMAVVHRHLRETQPDDATEKKQHWSIFDPLCEAITEALGLNWECGPEVIDRFRTACKTARKNPRAGWPKPRRLDRVCIPHRFTGGGAPVVTLESQRSKRFRMPILNPSHAAGAFGIGDDSIDFTAAVHRAVPANVIVKKVCWCGRRDVFGWHWHVTISVEVPPEEARDPQGRLCAIDLGWRKRTDGIRVAMLADSDGRLEELVLPFDFSTRDIRRSRDRGHYAAPSSWAELRALQAEISETVEEAKRDVAAILDMSARSSQRNETPAGFAKMRETGLRKLLNTTDSAACKQRLAEFFDRHRSLSRQYTAASNRIVNRRRCLYQNFAAYVARTYDAVSIEDSLDIKGMIEDDDKEAALEAGDRYHQYAATGELRAEIVKACKKYGARIVAAPVEFSTATCCVCGGEVKTGPNVVLSCESGHAMDQDANAAWNLLSQIDGVDAQDARLRSEGRIGRWEMPVFAGAL